MRDNVYSLVTIKINGNAYFNMGDQSQPAAGNLNVIQPDNLHTDVDNDVDRRLYINNKAEED